MATGSNWSWSQALRIRSKFWGKSMEFQPEGKIQLSLTSHGETYVWNKVTSCIHNILGAERWVDLYGECVITCAKSGLTARIQFVKASYWSNKRHEMSGTITDSTGNTRLSLVNTPNTLLSLVNAPNTHLSLVRVCGHQPVRQVVRGPVYRQGPLCPLHLAARLPARGSSALLRLLKVCD